jgi:NADPH2:quinone reductase
MQAVLCVEYGSHDKLVVSEVPDPAPGPGEILIDVRAASLNFPDLLVIRGLYQFKPEPPFVPGAESAGVIVELGEGVEGLSVGQRVTTVGISGGFASLRVVEANAAIPLPADADLEVAAGTTMTYGTSYHALTQRAGLGKGETLLVLGASGGVGSAAIEIGKALGASVIAAASTDEKLAFCSDIGADHTINYTNEDLRSRVREITGGHGADVIYDPVGGDLADPAFRSIAWGGRYLVIGFASGDVPAIPLNLPLLKVASIIGVFFGSFTQEQPRIAAANLQEISRMIIAGELSPAITETFPLEEAIDAFELLASRRAMGKVVLQVNGTS